MTDPAQLVLDLDEIVPAWASEDAVPIGDHDFERDMALAHAIRLRGVEIIVDGRLT